MPEPDHKQPIYVIVEHQDRLPGLNKAAQKADTVDHLRLLVQQMLGENLVVVDEEMAQAHSASSGLFAVVLGEGASHPAFSNSRRRKLPRDREVTQKIKVPVGGPKPKEVAEGLKANLVNLLAKLQETVDKPHGKNTTEEETIKNELNVILGAYVDGLKVIRDVQSTSEDDMKGHYREMVKEVSAGVPAFRLFDRVSQRLGRSDLPYDIHSYIIEIIRVPKQ